jgi:hypothetical protein
MKSKYLTIAGILSVVILICSTVLASSVGASFPGGDPRPDHGVIKVVTVSNAPPQPPKDWILVRDESYLYHNKHGQLVTIRTIEYRDPLISLLRGAECEECNGKESSSLSSSYCSYWYSWAIYSTAHVGGVIQHLYTPFSRYHWSGPGGSSAWYIPYSAIWWTRSSTKWDVGNTHVRIGPIYGARDCNYDKKYYGEYNDWFTPYWYNSNRTYTYKYWTTGRGTLMNAVCCPRLHQVGPTPVYPWGTLPELRHRFWQYSYGG